MAKNSRKKSLYRVRVRQGKGLFRSTLVVGRNPRKAAGKSQSGRILSITKVSMEELLKVGSYFELGDRLMKEFRKEESDEISKSAKAQHSETN